MNTNTTTRLTAADIEHLDIQELLNGIFASDVDLVEILNKGIEQVEQTRKIARQAVKAEKKAEKKAARAAKAIENAEVNEYRAKLVFNGVCAGVFAGVAIATRNPLVGGLAVTTTIRAGRCTKQMLAAIKVRDALRNGAIIEEDAEQALLALRNDARFEAVLGLVDAGLMVALGVQGKDPMWHVLAALELLVVGFCGALWADAGSKLRGNADAVLVDFVKPGHTKVKGGAHRATGPVVQSAVVTG